MAKKNPRKKKRTEYVYATTKGDVSEIVVTANSRTGKISFGTEMTNVYSEVTYDRPNQALSIADSASTQILDALQSGKAPFNNKPPLDNGSFESLRVIRPAR